jgi:hypothetical protein
MSCTDRNIGKLIASYELGLLSEEERHRFENHLLECEECFQSLYDTAPIANLMRDGKLAPSEKVELHNGKDKAPIRFFQKKWALAAAGVMVVFVIALAFVWLQGPAEKAQRLRGEDDVSILVLFPVGQVTTVDELQWKPVSGVDSYDVKIFTETNDLVWEGSASETKIALPDTIKETLIRGRTYYWQVEAQTGKGDRLKSQMIRFQIRN